MSAEECELAVNVPELIEEIAQGFIDYTAGQVVVPPVGYLGFTEPTGDVHLKYGYVKGGEVFVIKVAAGFPQNSLQGLPTGDGCMLVFSSHTGFLLAVLLDRSRLTDLRTAVAGAVAARTLAPRLVRRIGIIGTGVQARLQPLMLKHVTTCREIALYGRSGERAASCATYLELAGFRVTLCTTSEEVAESCELIVTTTASRAAHFPAGAVKPGTHITGRWSGRAGQAGARSRAVRTRGGGGGRQHRAVRGPRGSRGGARVRGHRAASRARARHRARESGGRTHERRADLDRRSHGRGGAGHRDRDPRDATQEWLPGILAPLLDPHRIATAIAGNG